MLLETYRQEISRCVKCGACSAVCPTFIEQRRESLSARGRIALIEAVLNGQLAVSEIYKDRLATCMGCLACEASCPSGVPVTEIIQSAKEQAIAESGTGIINTMIAGVLKHPAAFRATAWLAPIMLHYARGSGVRGQGTGGKSKGSSGKSRNASSEFVVKSSNAGEGESAKKRGSVVFFPGCAITGFQQDIGKSVRTVLDRLGYEVIVPDGLKCCGRPLLSLGDRTAAELHAEHNAVLFEATGADAIVTACASCSLTFKKEYPKLLRSGRKPPSVLDVHELLVREIAGLSFRPVRKRVTWHDPCHLGRGQGLSGKARDILRSIPGLELVEMNNADHCCGFGGMMRITHRGLSDGIAEAKVQNILATGASTVVTGCPGCRMQIGNALHRSGPDVEVLHTVQLIAEALGIEDFGSQNAECEILMQNR
ncbi:MAG: (Fe-S)-binding protein [Betaproteobacteria bacterium]